ncbi:MAG: hypothetical protein JWN27_3171, partial [Candidatus Eremiobacteraeota bacterium]|nr:hypothetical protein [Candidatus Eremiobacteraeota bacterium]
MIATLLDGMPVGARVRAAAERAA